MSLIDAALSRSRTVIATLVLLLVAGLAAYLGIPKEAEPDINIPIIYVSMNHRGISPEDAERLLIRPMETELRTIEGIKEIRATAYQGGANVLLEFDAGFDADAALADVRESVDLAKPELPSDTDEPTVNEVNISLFPVLVITMSGNLPERTLMRLASDLKDKIEGIPSVLEAKVSGDREERVEIVVDPPLVESYGLDVGQLLTALSRSNQLIAAGALDTGKGRFAIKVPGLFERVTDVFEMPVKVSGDTVVTLSDIATIRRTFKDRDIYARVNGKPAVVIEVSKRIGENIIDTVEDVRALTAAEQSSWPPGVDVRFTQDKSTMTRQILSDLQNNVVTAVLLVMIVIVGVLGLRSGLLVAIAIPGSFLTAILALQALGLTINIVVMFSLILSIGMLVDGAIVVTEYADRKMREGNSAQAAYRMAAKTLAWPVIASTGTTLAAFAPLLFWPGLIGEFMSFLPITLLATLSASLVMALIFVPVLGSNLAVIARPLIVILGIAGGGGLGGLAAYRLATGFFGLAPILSLWIYVALVAAAGALAGAHLGLMAGARATASLTSGKQDEKDAAQMRLLSGDSEGDLGALRGATGLYARLLARALRNPARILIAGAVFLVGAWVVYGQFGNGVEFFPDIEADQAIVQVHARGNLSVDEKNQLVGEVEGRVLDIEAERGEFKSIYALAGNLAGRSDDAEDIIGTISMEFVDWDKRRPADEILAEIVARSRDLGGIIVETRQAESGPQSGKPIQIELSSANPTLLARETGKVRAFLDQLEGLKDVEDSRPIPGIEWEVTVDRAQAAKFGADVIMIGNAIRLITNGLKLTEYRPDDTDDEIDIVARYPLAYRSVAELDRVRIVTPQGSVPISNFVTRNPSARTGLIRRVDGRRVLTVKAAVLPGVLVSETVKDIEAWLSAADVDPGVAVSIKGENEDQRDAGQFLQRAFLVAVFMMAIILVTQFNSFYAAFLILTAVIMSTSGVVIGLLVADQTFGIVMSGVGIIALAGIVVNNNIVLIDTYNRLMKRIKDPRQAILRAGAQRFRPVLLTTATTTLGLVPMALQLNIDWISRVVTFGAPSAQWWSQLATAIVAGLIFAVVPTLIVTPSALMVKANIASWRRRTATGEPAGPPAKIDVPGRGLPEAAE